MITHVGGLDAAADATLRLPDIPGGKKLIYTGISMPLTALTDFSGKLREIIAANSGLWCTAAEKYLLENGEAL